MSWLNSAGARSGPYHLLRLLGIDRYRTRFAADPALEWLRFDGGLWWTTPDGAERTRARHEHEIDRGYRNAGQCSGLQAGGEGPRGKAFWGLNVP
ncbi:hypothetical protein [Nonomuraea sp. NPDC003709]|uniref:hypothetical protein n=1 Tax=Nonomuraea sp. NPDC003709 TaxID=3154450 RepID=UPI0033BE5402